MDFKKKILIVDQSRIPAAILRSNKDLDIVSVETVPEAIFALGISAFNLVLTDKTEKTLKAFALSKRVSLVEILKPCTYDLIMYQIDKAILP